MAENLTEHLAGKECTGFDPRPHYFADGDFVTYFASEERACEERVDELLTVYRSMKTGNLVGCKIKGVRRILQTLGNFGVVVKEKSVVLGVLFMAAALARPERRDDYAKIGSQFGNTPMEAKELEAAMAA
jgi:hypothetical protein